MSARVTKGVWTPLPGSLPSRVDADTVYVIPTRAPGEGEDLPRYTDNVRYLPKHARVGGAPVEFSMPEGSRRYLQEFSAIEAWALGVAVFSMANDWLIFTVQQFIELRQLSQGWTREEVNALPLKVTAFNLDSGAVVLQAYEIEGSGTDVLEAIRTLRGEMSHDSNDNLDE